MAEKLDDFKRMAPGAVATVGLYLGGILMYAGPKAGELWLGLISCFVGVALCMLSGCTVGRLNAKASMWDDWKAEQREKQSCQKS